MLTITSTEPPATDLGYLLHKNPARVHERELPFGTARVIYPEATESRCCAALVVDVDPVGLVRGRRGPRPAAGLALVDYVNDRPYVASSYLAVALGQVFGTALTGRSRERPELAARPLALEIHVPVLPARGGAPFVHRLFEPLGYGVETAEVPLDPQFPGWGPSRCLDLRLRGRVVLRDLLEHLFVLLPVLDDDKHYWVGEAEVDKLLRRGRDWVAGHPLRDEITRRYLRHDRRLADDALARLMAADGAGADGGSGADDVDAGTADAEEAAVERPVRLNDQRLAAVIGVLEAAGARRILDLGCGQGTLVGQLLSRAWVERVVGVDVSWRALQVAARRLHLDDMTPRQRSRVELWQGALTYRDKRLRGFDAAAVVEVVEHLDPPRLAAFTRILFGDARPATVVLTTPNREYNRLFEALPEGQLRHRDHRFEWTRAELGSWAAEAAAAHGYRVELLPIGPVDAGAGPPTQMAVFRR
jgi:3' terminal RNA ribose 2'-O-methyltransferase Hen1